MILAIDFFTVRDKVEVYIGLFNKINSLYKPAYLAAIIAINLKAFSRNDGCLLILVHNEEHVSKIKDA